MLCTYLRVLSSRSFSSAKVVSLSGYFGGSTAASRETNPLQLSDTIWTCRPNGNISGYRRAPTSTDGSIFSLSACSLPFSSTAVRLCNARTSTGTTASWIDRLMELLLSFGGGTRDSRDLHSILIQNDARSKPRLIILQLQFAAVQS